MPGLFATVYAQWAGPVGDAFVRAKRLVDWAVTSVSSSRLSGARSRQVCQIPTTSGSSSPFRVLVDACETTLGDSQNADRRRMALR